jgi:hypothetical protein
VSVRAGWDFILMMITVVLLAALGAQSLVGALYAWWAQRAVEGWTQTAAYASYVSLMNAVAAPLVGALVVVLGLCVPKRLFARRTLLAVSAAMVVVGVAVGALTRSLQAVLGAYLVAAALLQAVVVALTFGRAGGMSYLTQGRGRRLGSALLHLGFILSTLVVVALQDSPLMLPVVFAGALLLAGGSAMSFYARG